MAIRDKFEEQEKNGMKVVTNMNGEKRADKKLMAKYEPGSNISDIKYDIYKKALREDRVKEIFPNEPIKLLREMYDRFMKESGGRIK